MTLKMLNASKKDWAASLPKNLAYEKREKALYRFSKSELTFFILKQPFFSIPMIYSTFYKRKKIP